MSKIILLVTKLDTRFRILVWAIIDLSDQERSIALEERIDRTINYVAVSFEKISL